MTAVALSSPMGKHEIDSQERERQAFGQRFSELVKGRDRGWKTALAKALDIGPEMITRYEKGLDLPSMPTATTLARELKVPINYLLTGDGPKDLWGDTKVLERVVAFVATILDEEDAEMEPEDLASLICILYGMHIRERCTTGALPTKDRIRAYMESHDVI